MGSQRVRHHLVTEQQQRWPEQQEFNSHTVLETPGSGCQLMCFLLTAFILVCRQLPPMAEKRGSNLSAVSSYKNINSIKKSPPSWPGLTLNTTTPPTKDPFPVTIILEAVVVVQSLSHLWLFATIWTVTSQACLLSKQAKFAQTHVHWFSPSNHHPLLLLPSIFPSIRVFFNELALRLGGQGIGASASASLLPMNIQVQFPLGLLGLISLQSKGLSRVFSRTTGSHLLNIGERVG